MSVQKYLVERFDNYVDSCKISTDFKALLKRVPANLKCSYVIYDYDSPSTFKFSTWAKNRVTYYVSQPFEHINQYTFEVFDVEETTRYVHLKECEFELAAKLISSFAPSPNTNVKDDSFITLPYQEFRQHILSDYQFNAELLQIFDILPEANAYSFNNNHEYIFELDTNAGTFVVMIKIVVPGSRCYVTIGNRWAEFRFKELSKFQIQNGVQNMLEDNDISYINPLFHHDFPQPPSETYPFVELDHLAQFLQSNNFIENVAYGLQLVSNEKLEHFENKSLKNLQYRLFSKKSKCPNVAIHILCENTALNNSVLLYVAFSSDLEYIPTREQFSKSYYVASRLENYDSERDKYVVGEYDAFSELLFQEFQEFERRNRDESYSLF